jgi:hypothetical protein
VVPVLSKDRKPLMPCSEKRARQLIERKQAFPFWSRGVFCIHLLKNPSDTKYQRVVCGIDPGSKREAYTVCTKDQTILNILSDTPYWISDAVKTRREMRIGRRFRKTPCRQPRQNNLRNKERLAPSTKARWQAKLRVLIWLSKIIPITDVIVEDIKAKTWKNKKKWNGSFSPLEVGKEWFYSNADQHWNLHAVSGYDTKRQRDKRGFTKSHKKLENCWNVHNIDSHCLCEIFFGKELDPFKCLLRINFLRFKRRMLHKLQFSKGGIRRREGSTRSFGFKRGSFVKHIKYGFVYIGGWMPGKGISLHRLESGERVCRTAKSKDCEFKTYLSWSFVIVKGV